MNATNDFVLSSDAGSLKIRLNYTGYYWLNDGSPLTRSWFTVPLPVAFGSPSKGPFAIRGHVQITYAADGVTTVGLRFFEVAVGGDYMKPNESAGTAAYSLDGGERWTASKNPPHGYRSTVQWFQPENLWITAGTNGSDFSTDDGRTWHPLDDGNWNALSLPFLVGPKGRIARIDANALRARVKAQK